MRLRQLEYFVAIADLGSMRRAAETLFVAQPSLSNQIAALEREVGGALLHRQPRGVTLTPAGRVFLREARRTLAAAERAKRSASLALGGEQGDVRFATVLSVAAGLVPPALLTWRGRHPEAHAYLHEYRSSQELERSTLQGLHDFAVGPKPTAVFEVTEFVGTEEFVVVLPEGDPLLDAATVDIATLGDRPWVRYDREHGLSSTLDEVFAAAGIAPEGAASTRQTDVAVRLATVGLGPALVPDNTVPPPFRRFARSMSTPLLRELYLYSPTPIPVLGRSLLTMLRRVCEKR
ncbi:LysR family transcriptional regulator [Streptomyces sp. AJS327]|uniref:LysR family transcriptional regulator n=1 Tax=Streptomyces sp. AJS327 TaxID=2545265 RepID=UPI0015DE3BB1|nr:LysR family transcriptional regulator [Streptomyces sp. AJS327]MBA0053211.1 LysR family transcriptional regulator [Streptomyces sp. AJS327]